MKNRLGSLQRELLVAFSPLAPDFFLTGGGALAGFHLGHRDTLDLDLFVTEERLDQGVSALHAAARSIGAGVEPLRTAPDQRRFLLRRGAEAIVVDLVHDPTPQGDEPKLSIEGIRVDPPREILANKLCALLSRSEVRDLVDVLALERAGHRSEDALPLAMRKDSGLTPAQLAFVLSGISIGDDARIPGSVSVRELRAFLARLCERLARAGHPGG